MFCQKCGIEIDDSAVICTSCGVPTVNFQQQQQQQQSQPNIIITNTNTATAGIGYITKSKVTALVLCFFLGFLGVHRFYVGKIGTGLIWLCTGGLLGFGVLLDLILILIGSFRDKAGQPLV